MSDFPDTHGTLDLGGEKPASENIGLHVKKEKGSVFSCTDPSGGLFTLITGKGDSQMFTIFLREAGKTYPKGKIVMSPDNVSFHKSFKVREHTKKNETFALSGIQYLLSV